MDYEPNSQPNQQPPMNQNPQSQGLSVAALVLGILGLVGGWIPIVRYFTTVCSLLAIILGVIARKKAMEAKEPTGMATAGLVLGIVAFGLSFLIIACVGAACGIFGMALS